MLLSFRLLFAHNEQLNGPVLKSKAHVAVGLQWKNITSESTHSDNPTHEA